MVPVETTSQRSRDCHNGDRSKETFKALHGLSPNGASLNYYVTGGILRVTPAESNETRFRRVILSARVATIPQVA
jgi:hypothetical protein